MKKFKKLVVIFFVFLFSIFFISSTVSDLDPKYIEKFGYNSICASGKGYPKIDKYDESQFDFRNGKFYIEKNTQLNLRAILPEGKKYWDLFTDFVSRAPDYKEDEALEKIIWRVFSSHDNSGNKIFSTWPPPNSELLKVLSYKTSDKELAFVTTDMSLRQPEVRQWTTSGMSWSNQSELEMLIGNWLSAAKPGYQLYIVHTVGYLEAHKTTNNYIVDDPIITAIVEIK
jgi:hypothetical protein